jgi:anti-anti-sigma factor
VKLTIETSTINRRAVLLTLRGEIDYASAQDLRSAITTAIAGSIDRLVISMAGVTFLDSTGIGTLVVARRICDGVRVRLEVRDANPFIARLFEVVGVAEMLGVTAPGGMPGGSPGAASRTAQRSVPFGAAPGAALDPGLAPAPGVMPGIAPGIAPGGVLPQAMPAPRVATEPTPQPA